MRRQVPSTPPGLDILDVGCGTGLNAARIAANGHQVRGIDISPTAIAKFVAQGFEGQVCDLEGGIPFGDSEFDLVYASEVIEHLADTEAFLSDIFRVLKPGGTLLLSTPNSSFWVYRVFSVLGSTLSDVQHPGHVRFFSRTSLTRCLETAGFVEASVSARHIFLILGNAFRPLRG